MFDCDWSIVHSSVSSPSSPARSSSSSSSSSSRRRSINRERLNRPYVAMSDTPLTAAAAPSAFAAPSAAAGQSGSNQSINLPIIQTDDEDGVTIVSSTAHEVIIVSSTAHANASSASAMEEDDDSKDIRDNELMIASADEHEDVDMLGDDQQSTSLSNVDNMDIDQGSSIQKATTKRVNAPGPARGSSSKVRNTGGGLSSSKGIGHGQLRSGAKAYDDAVQVRFKRALRHRCGAWMRR